MSRVRSLHTDDGSSVGGERRIALSDELVDVLDDLPDELAGLAADDALREAARIHREHLVQWVEVPADDGAPEAHVVVAGVTIRLRAGEELVIGRRGEIVVDDPLVSRRHVVLEATSDGLIARDLDSANGTWLVRDGVRTVVDGAGCALSSADRLVTVDDRELLSVIEVGS